jgi:hypothetical protein
MRTMNYSEFLTSADADILAGSELESAPGNGVYVIHVASTVNTATLAVNGNRSPIVSSARSITLRANAESRAEDVPWIVNVSQGEKITAALAGTTGTVGFYAQYVGS